MCQLCAISAHAHTFKSKVDPSSLTAGGLSQFTLCLSCGTGRTSEEFSHRSWKWLIAQHNLEWDRSLRNRGKHLQRCSNIRHSPITCEQTLLCLHSSRHSSCVPRGTGIKGSHTSHTVTFWEEDLDLGRMMRERAISRFLLTSRQTEMGLSIKKRVIRVEGSFWKISVLLKSNRI